MSKYELRKFFDEASDDQLFSVSEILNILSIDYKEFTKNLAINSIKIDKFICVGDEWYCKKSWIKDAFFGDTKSRIKYLNDIILCDAGLRGDQGISLSEVGCEGTVYFDCTFNSWFIRNMTYRIYQDLVNSCRKFINNDDDYFCFNVSIDFTYPFVFPFFSQQLSFDAKKFISLDCIFVDESIDSLIEKIIDDNENLICLYYDGGILNVFDKNKLFKVFDSVKKEFEDCASRFFMKDIKIVLKES